MLNDFRDYNFLDRQDDFDDYNPLILGRNEPKTFYDPLGPNIQSRQTTFYDPHKVEPVLPPKPDPFLQDSLGLGSIPGQHLLQQLNPGLPPGF